MPQAATITAATTRTPPQPADDAPHLLLVDDDRRIRDLLSRFLSGEGYRVTTASSANDARAKLLGLHFDLLKVESSYQWYRQNGQWEFEPVKRTERVASGTVDIAADKPGRLSLPVKWGRYRLEVTTGEANGPVTSLSFDAGFYAEANADTPDQSTNARARGAEGIGLTRTEHMFLGDRRVLIERVILSDSGEERDEALAALLPLQTQDFTELLEAMDGLPVTIRLLDPPLHEFLPNFTELSVRVALAHASGTPDVGDLALLAAVERLHESNPMLGLRGVRLGLVVPGLFALQVRAIAEAALARITAGGDPHVEIMVPLVGSVMELHLIADETDGIVKEIAEREGVDLRIPVGTMIELPRAALTAHRIADVAEFFSFGTNDLTQFLFAADRSNPKLAERYDWLSISIMRFLRRVQASLVGHAVDVTVCGEMGGRRLEALALMGIGIRRLSITPASVGPIKELVRKVDLPEIGEAMKQWLSVPPPSLREALTGWAEARGIEID